MSEKVSQADQGAYGKRVLANHSRSGVYTVGLISQAGQGRPDASAVVQMVLFMPTPDKALAGTSVTALIFTILLTRTDVSALLSYFSVGFPSTPCHINRSPIK